VPVSTRTEEDGSLPIRRGLPRWTLALRRVSCHHLEGFDSGVVDESTIALGVDDDGGGRGEVPGGDERSGEEGALLKSPKMFIARTVRGKLSDHRIERFGFE
jgi:hypothetical protein